MPPKPCPTRLQRLIDDDPQTLRQILGALKDRRQNKGPATYAFQSMSRVTIDLTDYSVRVRNELELALKESDLPTDLDLIHECPVCHVLFWAGRVDKEACPNHAERWRKNKQRQRKKLDAEKQEAQRKEAQLARELNQLSRTAVALLNAIVFGGSHIFYEIDYDAWVELKDDPAVRRVTNTEIVRLTLNMMVRRGYLRHVHQGDHDQDHYFPEQHLVKAWTELHRKLG